VNPFSKFAYADGKDGMGHPERILMRVSAMHVTLVVSRQQAHTGTSFFRMRLITAELCVTALVGRHNIHTEQVLTWHVPLVSCMGLTNFFYGRFGTQQMDVVVKRMRHHIVIEFSWCYFSTGIGPLG
jgi:hypothetical protein